MTETGKANMRKPGEAWWVSDLAAGSKEVIKWSALIKTTRTISGQPCKQRAPNNHCSELQNQIVEDGRGLGGWL